MSKPKPKPETPKTLKQWQLRKLIRQYVPTARVLDAKSGEVIIIVPPDKDPL